jgi:radical SAM superfamily enzyme YgiQ (UPF0313 family)
MNEKIRRYQEQLIRSEERLLPRPRGHVPLGLIYPNSYYIGMSNLGFQTLQALTDAHPGFVTERFFLPDPTIMGEFERTHQELVSLETLTPMTCFEVLAFSVSYEGDFVNIPALLQLGHIPPLARDRQEQHPLIIGGGAALTLNPEPVAPFFDLIFLGEAEQKFPELLDCLFESRRSLTDRPSLLRALAQWPGVYVPSLYQAEFGGSGEFLGFSSSRGAPLPIQKVLNPDITLFPSQQVILTENTEFRRMHLIEISRGCQWGCRFCAGGFLYLPHRPRTAASILDSVRQALPYTNKIGLVGPAISDYPDIGPLCDEILALGGVPSFSSFRIDSISPDRSALLFKQGQKTVTLAIEAGGERLRRVINKHLDDSLIYQVIERLVAAEVLNLKLYFMIGIPGETAADIEAMISQIEEIRRIMIRGGRQKGRLGDIIVSVNPFIPKPWTPLQWEGVASLADLKRTRQTITRRLQKLPHIKLKFESEKNALFQAALARGDRRYAELCLKAVRGGLSEVVADPLWQAESERTFFRTRAATEPFPWEIVSPGLKREYLWRERQKSLIAEESSPCQPGCRRCGVCAQ